MVAGHFTASGFFGKVSQQSEKVKQQTEKNSQRFLIYQSFFDGA